MKSIIPNLFMDNCRDSLEFYKGVFGGELKNIVLRQESQEKIMHAELHINKNCALFFGDKLEEGQRDPNIHIFLALDTEAEIRSIYNALKEDGDVDIELHKSFWDTLHAVVTDKNGITWDLDMA
jgi:PhnB protein